MAPLLLSLALFLCSAVLPAGAADAAVEAPCLQEPEDPSRVLNLLNGLVDRVQESNPLLAGVIRFLGFLVWLFLHIKVWGPPLLIAVLLVGGFLVWQARRKKKEAPMEGVEEEAGL